MQTPTHVSSRTRKNHRPMAAPKPRKTPASFLAKVSAMTAGAVADCRAAQAGQLVSDHSLEGFMEALDRVTNCANVWRSQLLCFLAPVVFALDAELTAEAEDVQIPEALLGKAIQEATLAGAQAWFAPSDLSKGGE